jgi:hypothetical protein
MKHLTTPLFAFILIFVFSVGVIVGRYDQANRPKYGELRVEPAKPAWDMPYSVHVIDEAEVQLISKLDTVTLLMENATLMAEEHEIFVNIKR